MEEIALADLLLAEIALASNWLSYWRGSNGHPQRREVEKGIKHRIVNNAKIWSTLVIEEGGIMV